MSCHQCGISSESYKSFSLLDTLVFSDNRPILNSFTLKVIKSDCEFDIYLLIASKYDDLKVFLKLVQVNLTYISWLDNFACLFKDPKLCH